MPRSSNRSSTHLMVIVPVVLIILGALTMAFFSIKENMRFSEAASQILSLDRVVRSFAAQQTAFMLAPGEDVWATMSRLGQTHSNKVNPWGYAVTAVGGQGHTMRMESIIPTHVCRRIALYVMETDPNEIGLLGIEALPEKAPAWNIIYPPPDAEVEGVIKRSCGETLVARLGFTFRIR